jgi:hypothetical protein
MVSRKRVIGFATIFCLTCVVAADGTLARTAGFGGGGLPVLLGLHNSTSMAPLHGSPPPAPVLGHRRFTFRASPARQFGFGFPPTTFGYGFSGSPFDYSSQVVQINFNAPPPPLGACSSFYCTYYDPSHATYVDPERSRYDSPPTIGRDVSPVQRRQSCDSETVIVPAGDHRERSVTILRC